MITELRLFTFANGQQEDKAMSVGFAIIGSNFITDTFIKGLQQCSQVKLVGIYSRDPAKAQAKFTQHYGQPDAGIAFGSLEALCACSDVDAVYIASPNSLHFAQSKQCLLAGKHVLLEKPACSNQAQLSELIELANQQKKLLAQGILSFSSPIYDRFKECVNKLGKIERYHGEYCQRSSRLDLLLKGELPNTFNPEFSNGALMDLGIYPLAPMVALFGLPTKLQAQGKLLSTGVDGMGEIQFDYPDLLASIAYSKITLGQNIIEIQGENGRLTVHSTSLFERLELELITGENTSIEGVDHVGAMRSQIVAFCQDVQSGTLLPSKVSHQISLAIQQLLDATRKQLGVIYPQDLEN